ncbi:NUDIX hydrolase [Lentzea cavernae]|uniref:DNA mismatch repair protein MutT n=1 Tax=Lentzea cavernae TaxID=2020703 RepID=A0ABQ3N129_9PSEU|nr:NUDIX domain-containing protein [Lentzea cavernae]GHH57867.1 DNA mismatch repair protein MutT [Lentzea cavernae]
MTPDLPQRILAAIEATEQLDAPRLGARVLLLNAEDRVLLVHARDPQDADHHWWELPGGGVEPDEKPTDAACREVAEETGIVLPRVDRHLWTRESRFHYMGRDHHRIDLVFLARVADAAPTVALQPTENEKAGVIERRWWTAADLHKCADKVLPANLAGLLDDVLAGTLSDKPLIID